MNSDFLYWIAFIGLASPTAIEEDPASLVSDPVGSGPYILDEQVPAVSASFTRNPEYRAPDLFPFDRIESYVFADSVAVANALKSGQLNLAQVDTSLAADLEQNGFALSLGTNVHYFLTWPKVSETTTPALADPRVRQAIAYALDREAIIESIENGYGTVTTQLWAKGSPYYIEGADDTYAYDPEKARRLLAEAGYADGFDLAIANSGNFKYEPYIEQALADVGIRATFANAVDNGQIDQEVKSGKYGLYLSAASDLSVNTVLRSYAGNPELDALWETVDTGDREESEAAEREIGQLVHDDVLAIAVSRPAITWASIPEITVATSIVASARPLVDIQLAD